MNYSPPYIYAGLYEEESKGFEIVGSVRRETLISKSEQESLQKKPLRIHKMRGVDAENLYYSAAAVTRLIIYACPPLVQTMTNSAGGIQAGGDIRRGDGSGALA